MKSYRESPHTPSATRRTSSTSRSAIGGLLTALVLSAAFAGFASEPLRAAPVPMTADEIVALAQTGVGYSYWWGGACWTEGLTTPGSCAGNCPDCTHTGPWGADCSGFVGKVWQVPGPVDLETCSHPYSTRSFRWETYHWQPVPWDDVVRADAFVYRNAANTGGHVFLYESGDPWGNVWAYECRGCSEGCTHNLRSVSTAYIAIRRDELVDQPTLPENGTLRGVVFVDRGQGTADMTERLPGAQVQVVGAAAAPVVAAAGDASWSFVIAPGTYTVRVTASGHQAGERTCDVVAGEVTWCSIGVAPLCTPNCAGLECGPDPLCGASCGACAAGQVCAGGRCGCTPDCSGRECGPDPVCGADCGSCPGGENCGGGVCGCTPDCGGRVCGPDPICGASCGACGAGAACEAGQCVCAPDCSGRECGPDPFCGADCGTCADDAPCVDGQCACDPVCGERECGPDPVCGADCGACPPGWTCRVDGRCTCTPACGDRECGLDPACGTLCGTCAPNDACSADGRCVSLGDDDPGAPDGTCEDACAGAECGPAPQGCEGSCGRCTPDRACAAGRCVLYGDDIGKLYGRVTRGEGGPACPSAAVDVNGQSVAHTDPEGWYELLVMPGTFTVHVEDDGFSGEVACQVAGGEAVECSLALTAGSGDGGGGIPTTPNSLTDPGDGASGCATGPATAPLPVLLLLLLLGLAIARPRAGRDR